MAARLRQEAGLDVELVDGDRGELSVSVDGKEVYRKTGDTFPTEEEVVTAVHQAMPAHT